MAVSVSRSLASAGHSDQSRGKWRCQKGLGSDAVAFRSFAVPLREDRLLLENTLALLKTIQDIASIEPSEAGFAKGSHKKTRPKTGFLRM